MSPMDTEAARISAVIAQHLENVRRGVVAVCGWTMNRNDLGKGENDAD